MSLKLIPILIFVSFVMSGCGGASQRGLVEWENACASDIGTRINRIVRGVDGVIVEGVHIRQSDWQPAKDRELYRVALIGSFFGEHSTKYKYVEFATGEDGTYLDSAAYRFELPAGKYRATYEKDDHPRCSKYSRKWIEKYGRCFVFSPVSAFSANHKVVYSKTTTWYDSTYLVTTNYRVEKPANDELIAKHTSHLLGWREGRVPFTFGTSSAVHKSCPETANNFNIRDVLKPAKTN
jgi:hypothetical protein